MTPKERERIEKEYTEKYGNKSNQFQTIITDASLRWNPMTFPTKDLMLFEEIDADFEVILDFYGMDQNIFTKSQGSTFENKRQGLKDTYQNTIIPEADSFAQDLTKFLGLKNERLILDYSHLPVFQEDIREESVAANNMTRSVIDLLNQNLISEDEARNILKNYINLQ